MVCALGSVQPVIEMDSDGAPLVSAGAHAAPFMLALVGFLVPVMLMFTSYYYYTLGDVPRVDTDMQKERFDLENPDGTTYTVNYHVESGRSLTDAVMFSTHDSDYEYDIRDIEWENGVVWKNTADLSNYDDVEGGIVSFSVVKVDCRGGCVVNVDPGETVGGWNEHDGVFTFDDGASHYWSNSYIRFETRDTDLWEQDRLAYEENAQRAEITVGACCLAPVCGVMVVLVGLLGTLAGRHELWVGGLAGLALYPIFFIFMGLKILNDTCTGGLPC